MLKIEACIGDHAVLQCNKSLVINGIATPEHHIFIKLGDITLTILSTGSGSFQVALPPMSPAGPLDLKINDIDGHDELCFHDIYIGNVYLISGQSNMALTLGSAKDVCDEYSDDLIRQLEIKKQALIPANIEYGKPWHIAKDDSLKDFSAVGFHFAREMRKHSHDIAVGLVNASYGGTNIEAWISRKSLLASSLTQKQVNDYQPTAVKNPPNREQLEQKLLEKLFPVSFPNLGLKRHWHEISFCDSDWSQMILPDSWTLAGYKSPGTFWFRREIDLPDEWSGNDLQLRLGAIDHQDVVYWNGVEIGHTGNGLDAACWNDLRSYSIPANLLISGKNLIAVRAASFSTVCTNGGFIGPEDEMSLSMDGASDEKIPLNGRWKYKPEVLIKEDWPEYCRCLGAGEPHSYHIMFDNMIAPVRDCRFAAAVFYQGEANTLGKTDNYEGLLKLLIDDWRRHLAQPDLPFVIIQLPGFQASRLYSEHSKWAKIRDAQLKAALSTGIPPVVIAESGSAYDLHPPDKKTAGKRLAMAILSIQGNNNFSISGPVYRSMEKLPGGKIRLHFELFGDEMFTKGESVEHLVIAGSDGVFHKAEAKLEQAGALLVWSDAVPYPETVCYAWCENPAFANLYNQAGQPASPFRTDSEYN